MALAKTLGELKASGWQSRSVRDEIRSNLMASLRSGKPLFPTLVGYEKTVIPQVVNALLAKHDLILLGLRGQAKTMLIRLIPTLLDEHLPALTGTPLNEDPLAPLTPIGLKIIEEKGDSAPIHWLGRKDRYHEKLATPDTSVADLIGDVDPVKAARDRLDLSDPGSIHWGLIPRSHRGIFAINEVPDLQPRIQVGLLNLLEEGDIQIRGFPLRLPVDVLFVFTANPEDYTNRGNLITPLKDRIASQILTHYPRNLEEAKAITRSQAKVGGGLELPEFFRDVVEGIAFQARSSEFVDPASGVSARLSIAALENVAANMERRSLVHGGKPFPRAADLYAAIPAITGKLELVHEGEQEGPAIVAANLIALSIRSWFDTALPKPVKEGRKDRGRGAMSPEELFEHPENVEERKASQKKAHDPWAGVLRHFQGGGEVQLGDETPESEYRKALDGVHDLRQMVEKNLKTTDESEIYLGMELALEGLYAHQCLSRRMGENAMTYLDNTARMLKGLQG